MKEGCRGSQPRSEDALRRECDLRVLPELGGWAGTGKARALATPAQLPVCHRYPFGLHGKTLGPRLLPCHLLALYCVPITWDSLVLRSPLLMILFKN